MIQEKSWYKSIMKASKYCDSIINFICIVLLTAQILSILIMVFGRYLFSYVPSWSEQFAIFCMVWFAMFSIALAVRDDSHVKVEIIDTLVSPKVLLGFKMFANLCTMVFGFILVFHGVFVTQLTWPTMLSSFRVPLGLQYFSAVAGGFFMVVNAVIFSIEVIAKYIDKNNCEGKEI